MKEYGKRSHAALTIMRESIKIVIFAAIISSIGGIGLENAREKLAAILPLLIMIPALNDMIGDYGTIISSKFTTMIYTGKVSVGAEALKSPELGKLARIIFIAAFISAIYMGFISYAIAYYNGFAFSAGTLMKVVGAAVLSTTILVLTIFFVSVFAGIYVYRRREDPNNFLIPITTALADFASMLLFSYIIVWLF